MRISENISIKELLSKLDWDTPYGSNDLQTMGLPSIAAARLAQSGWLKRLGRGVYQVPNGKLDVNKALAYLSLEVPELHVGLARDTPQSGASRTVELMGPQDGTTPSMVHRHFQRHLSVNQDF